MKRLLFLLSFTLLHASIYSTNITPSSVKKEYMGIEILDQKKINLGNVGGYSFSEISDLAYNQTKKTLYMVSDEGIVFVFNATFGQTITQLTPQKAIKLVKSNGKNFKNWERDTEGATLDSRNRLLLSFEGQPKIGLFGENGRLQTQYKVPYKISQIKFLRGKNKGIEALAYHPRYGLVMSTEYPIKSDNKKIQTIYSSSGYEWKFKASSAQNSAVTGLEVMDDGNILVLERAYNGLFAPFVVTLKKVYINKKCHKKRLCKDEVLAVFDNSKGWSLDNFEGITKVGKDSYLIVSDDGDNFYQDTLLIYFRVK
ncbi:MAG: esterase-like activity of phytase family protein [Campylobacterales bacterium]|nr:esterase-like activity of phytase family protein [Campylobacterales bacterium]